jgi:hypothetical protein
MRNEEKVPLEVFVFSKDEDPAIYSFEALMDGKNIVVELQERMKELMISTFPPLLLTAICLE